MKKKKRKNFRLANGAGSVYKLGGNRRNPFAAVMSVGYTDDGILKRKYIGYYETYEDALHALEMYKETPFDLENKNITIARLYEILLERKKGRAERTLISYKTAYNHLSEIHQTPIRNLRTHDYQRILNSLDIKNKSKGNIKSLLNQLYKIAIELDIINKNYSTPLNCGNREESTLHKPFTVLEIRRLWELSKTDNFAEIPLILCYTGMRPQELTWIKKEDVHLDENYFIGGMKTDAGKNRVIPIHHAIRPIIERLLSENKEYLIETRHHKRFSYANLLSNWTKFMVEAGLSHVPHDGRHTFASFAKKKKMDPLLVKRIIGHKSQDLTEQVYTHTDIQDLVSAVNDL